MRPASVFSSIQLLNSRARKGMKTMIVDSRHFIIRNEPCTLFNL